MDTKRFLFIFCQALTDCGDRPICGVCDEDCELIEERRLSYFEAFTLKYPQASPLKPQCLPALTSHLSIARIWRMATTPTSTTAGGCLLYQSLLWVFLTIPLLQEVLALYWGP